MSLQFSRSDLAAIENRGGWLGGDAMRWLVDRIGAGVPVTVTD